MQTEIQTVDMADGSSVAIEINTNTGRVVAIVDGNGSASTEDMQAIADKWEGRA